MEDSDCAAALVWLQADGAHRANRARILTTSFGEPRRRLAFISKWPRRFLLRFFRSTNSDIVWTSSRMRVRIFRAVAGVLDGQSLGKLTPGLLYELDDALARQLISMGCAREEKSHAPALVMRVTDEPLDEARLTGGVRVVPRAKADDDARADRRQGAVDRRKHPRSDRRKTHF